MSGVLANDAESVTLHEAQESYEAAFPLRSGQSYRAWRDAGREYAIRQLARRRGWRNAYDDGSPYYPEIMHERALRERIGERQ